MIRRVIDSSICDGCPQKEKCGIIQTVLKDYDEAFIELLDRREFERFVSLSITAANCISDFEKKHSNFLHLLLTSSFDFDYICYYILDIKFRVWKYSIQLLADLLKFLFIVYSRNKERCVNFKGHVLSVINYYGKKYDEILNNKIKELIRKKNKSEKTDLRIKIIDVFSKVHKNIYEIFRAQVKNFEDPEHNGEYNRFLTRYSDLLISAMELTVVEVASINRIFIDKKVYVTSEVINWLIDYDYNLIKDIIETTKIKPVEIIYAEKGTERFRSYFAEVVGA
jgi:hypothetical protein